MDQTKYGTAPLFFVDEEKQKEWDAIDPKIKNEITKNLHHTMKMMSLEMQIEMLCHLYNDLNKRVDAFAGDAE